MALGASSLSVPPSIQVKRGNSVMHPHEGETAELKCDVAGRPQPEVTWEKVVSTKTYWDDESRNDPTKVIHLW